MLENPKVKQEFERMLDLACSLGALRQARSRVENEITFLPHNAVALQVKGKNVPDEKTRLDAELARIETQERDVRRDVSQFFASLGREVNAENAKQVSEMLPKRLKIKALLTEACEIIQSLETVEAEYGQDLVAMRKMAAAFTEQTKDVYPLPESVFPAAFVPQPENSAISRRVSVLLTSVASKIS